MSAEYQTTINHLVKQLEDIQSGKLWMGGCYDQKLLLSPGQNFIEPLPSVHSVGQILAHLIAWSDDLLLKISKGSGMLRDCDELSWPSNEGLQLVPNPYLFCSLSIRKQS